MIISLGDDGSGNGTFQVSIQVYANLPAIVMSGLNTQDVTDMANAIAQFQASGPGTYGSIDNTPAA